MTDNKLEQGSVECEKHSEGIVCSNEKGAVVAIQENRANLSYKDNEATAGEDRFNVRGGMMEKQEIEPGTSKIKTSFKTSNELSHYVNSDALQVNQ